MIVVDASVRVAANMPADVHYAESRSFIRTAIVNGHQLAAPILLPIEVAAAIALRWLARASPAPCPSHTENPDIAPAYYR